MSINFNGNMSGYMSANNRQNTNSLLLYTGAEVRVAVLDSGIDPSTPGLRRRNGKVFDCIQQGEELRVVEISNTINSDRNGHGSMVESCLLAVAPDVSVDHYRVLDVNSNCSGNLLCYALDHVIQKNYNIVNLSLGTRNEEHIPWLVSIVRRAYENDITVVAACSNVGSFLYPARFTYCISCEAMEGEHPLQLRYRARNVIEFSAWGVNIPMYKTNEEMTSVSGSSYAAAHVTGLAARALEMLGGKASPLDIKLLLREYALSVDHSNNNKRTVI